MSEKNREILFSVTAKDLDFQSFTVGGAGGQGRDHVNSGVRYVHRDSGARGESREFREQGRNKKVALKRLIEDPKFTFWVHQRCQELEGRQTAEEWADAELKDPRKIRTEIKDPAGAWVEISG